MDAGSGDGTSDTDGWPNRLGNSFAISPAHHHHHNQIKSKAHTSNEHQPSRRRARSTEESGSGLTGVAGGGAGGAVGEGEGGAEDGGEGERVLEAAGLHLAVDRREPGGAARWTPARRRRRRSPPPPPPPCAARFGLVLEWFRGWKRICRESSVGVGGCDAVGFYDERRLDWIGGIARRGWCWVAGFAAKPLGFVANFPVWSAAAGTWKLEEDLGGGFATGTLGIREIAHLD